MENGKEPIVKLITEEEWVAMTYEECKRMDEEYNTPERSPMHRSQRFPALWAEELKFNHNWYISCLGE